MRRPSTETGPDPPATRAARDARYRSATSYPGGPNWGPAPVTATNLIELNPYGRWTVNMATRRTTANGTLATDTKAPIRTANPPTNSTRMVAQAMTSGAGTPRACKVLEKPLGPLESLANPWAMKPYPTITRNGAAHQVAIDGWNGYEREWGASFIVCTFRPEDSCRKKCVRCMRELRRERVQIFDVGRRSQQIRCTCHEGCRNAPGQVGLAVGVMRNASKIPKLKGPNFSANHAVVPGSFSTSGRADRRNCSSSSSLPGFVAKRTNKPTVTISTPPSDTCDSMGSPS